MTYRKNSTKQYEIYGISGAKGHGKDTFANLIIKNSRGKSSFKILHFADDLKKIASRIFGIPIESFTDPLKKEIAFDIPLNLDFFIPSMNSETGLLINPLGFVAKTPREVMQLFGTEYVRGIDDDYWIKRTIGKILSNKRVLIPDTRFIKEANKICSINGKIIEIIRIDIPESGDIHSSESERNLINPDLVVGIRTNDFSLPTRVAKLIAMGKFKSAQRYDYRLAKKAILHYQNGNSLESSARLLGENHKDPYCMKNILSYYGVPIRKQCKTRVLHNIIDNIEYKWCSVCSSWKILNDFNYNTKSWDSLAGLCRECASKRNKNLYINCKMNSLQKIFNNSKRTAKYRDISFNITIDLINDLFKKQEGKCFYSGYVLDFEPGSINKITIDRVDSTKGYEPDNVVLCSFMINMMKRSLTVKDFSVVISDLYKRLNLWNI